MFSVKPSKWFWRGDENHPCDVSFYTDEEERAMQSFSMWKGGAQFFGSIAFPSTKIKSYSGSFSLPLFSEYNKKFNVEFGDDEGEIMFFNVEYKCARTFNRWEKPKEYN